MTLGQSWDCRRSRPLSVFHSLTRTPGRRPRMTTLTNSSKSCQSGIRRRTWTHLISYSTTFPTRPRRKEQNSVLKTRVPQHQMSLCPRKMKAQKMFISPRSLKPTWKPSPESPGCSKPKLKAIELNLSDQRRPRVRLRWRFTTRRWTSRWSSLTASSLHYRAAPVSLISPPAWSTSAGVWVRWPHPPLWSPGLNHKVRSDDAILSVWSQHKSI